MLADPAMNTCEPFSFSPWNSALISSMPAVTVGTEAGRLAMNFTTWYDGPLSDALGGAGLAIVDSCWKFGIMMMPAAPFFAA